MVVSWSGDAAGARSMQHGAAAAMWRGRRQLGHPGSRLGRDPEAGQEASGVSRPKGVGDGLQRKAV